MEDRTQIRKEKAVKQQKGVEEEHLDEEKEELPYIPLFSFITYVPPIFY
ncbi:MAG: hypothetical protein ACFFDK_18165 [Promethearchaeota archaeon]